MGDPPVQPNLLINFFGEIHIFVIFLRYAQMDSLDMDTCFALGL